MGRLLSREKNNNIGSGSGFLFLGDGNILKVVIYRQNIKGVRDEENNMPVYRIVDVDRMFDKTAYNIR
jgi:hypothetical protein